MSTPHLEALCSYLSSPRAGEAVVCEPVSPVSDYQWLCTGHLYVGTFCSTGGCAPYVFPSSYSKSFYCLPIKPSVLIPAVSLVNRWPTRLFPLVGMNNKVMRNLESVWEEGED